MNAATKTNSVIMTLLATSLLVLCGYMAIEAPEVGNMTQYQTSTSLTFTAGAIKACDGKTFEMVDNNTIQCN